MIAWTPKGNGRLANRARGAVRGPRVRRMVRLVQVLPRGAAAALRHRGRALHVRFHRRGGHAPASRTGSCYVLPRVFPDKLARPQRLRVVRRGVGNGEGAAGRVHQEDHRLRARRQQLRRVPRRERIARRRTTTRRSSPPARTTPSISRRSSASSSTARTIRDSTPARLMDEINLDADLSWIDKQIYRFVLIPITRKAAAGARAAVRVDLPPRPAAMARLGARPRRRR